MLPERHHVHLGWIMKSHRVSDRNRSRPGWDWAASLLEALSFSVSLTCPLERNNWSLEIVLVVFILSLCHLAFKTLVIKLLKKKKKEKEKKKKPGVT